MTQVEFLNKMIATCKVCEANTKFRHWTIKGDKFRSVHLTLDEIANTLYAFVDNIAETVVTLHAIPYGTMTEFLTNSEIAQTEVMFDADRIIEDEIFELSVILGLAEEARQDGVMDGITENDVFGRMSMLRHWYYFLLGMKKRDADE